MVNVTRRGRPRAAKIKKDFGTPELQQKRKVGQTIEVLDWCLNQRIINSNQHWAGMHFRWLYTLKFGAPTVKSSAGFCVGDEVSACVATYDEEGDIWRQQREVEYSRAVMLLEKVGYKRDIFNICIFNVFSSKINDVCLRDGLDLLYDEWHSD